MSIIITLRTLSRTARSSSRTSPPRRWRQTASPSLPTKPSTLLGWLKSACVCLSYRRLSDHIAPPVSILWLCPGPFPFPRVIVEDPEGALIYRHQCGTAIRRHARKQITVTGQYALAMITYMVYITIPIVLSVVLFDPRSLRPAFLHTSPARVPSPPESIVLAALSPSVGANYRGVTLFPLNINRMQRQLIVGPSFHFGAPYLFAH
ncbi:hypothetical protein HBI18_224960 [Parastagonospora nodorum]|nr:hypothetical protein HBI12_211890 [Parastagonospora nodorum]KAH5710439.1 hypothetical protein HBI18_224960 [Parastagonospora nodorum]KAH6139785.1 hypothetical protein HBI68_221610 [Parastagonospora nodorum]KAH6323756.1 hypothetical protein HBI37_225500 [Parastagonospora nodorum]KAH6336495.1 hypothetical protein HBI36_223050 [Parastagonospora nodorum]